MKWSYGCLSILFLIASLKTTGQPVEKTYDICIYGATSAGIIAAFTARTMGKSVVVIEPGHHPGGMSSGGLGQTDIGNKVAITGWARDFYKRIGSHYGKKEQWIFEPHVAEEVFNGYIHEEDIEIRYGLQITRVQKEKLRISEVSFISESGGLNKIKALMFIDCTYEGDLMAMAGVSFAIGRESNTQYHETYNGVQLLDKHQFHNGIDPYRIPGNSKSGLLWGIGTDSLRPPGSADKKIQAYNFRICLTNDPSNRLEITRPAGYDSIKYELLIRQIAKVPPDTLNWQLLHIAPMPNHKTDINNCGGFSSDMIGMNYDYPLASPKRRLEIINEHISYTMGWLYFLGHDKRIPLKLRLEMAQWGYPMDEYQDNHHFTHQLYIREARRMIGSYVMTQHNCEGSEVVTDGVGLAAYTMDSHNCQRLVYRGMVKNEGDVQVGGFGPYPVSYRALIPKKSECENLFVPVCLSASHIAYGSIRMEPVFMVLGQAVASAASLAIDTHLPVQDIPIKKLQKILRSSP